MSSHKILILGAAGQIGSELTAKLRAIHGKDNVIASDINYNNTALVNSGIFEIVDALNYVSLKVCCEKYNIDTIYLMVAMLSAKGEKYPMKAWDLNVTSLFNVLNLAKAKFINKIFWPSSIAVFGPTTPKENAPQYTITEPNTVYGMTKLIGERWCQYYNEKYDVDIRSLRYPGIISWKTLPGGGTTDYAVEIYYEALAKKKYNCFLAENTELPMMYMDDAIEATVAIMSVPTGGIKIRSSYNISAVSYTPKQVAESIKKHIPEFEISYSPDFRQDIANSWPKRIDDSEARKDWGWRHKFDLELITNEMLKQLSRK